MMLYLVQICPHPNSSGWTYSFICTPQLQRIKLHLGISTLWTRLLNLASPSSAPCHPQNHSIALRNRYAQRTVASVCKSSLDSVCTAVLFCRSVEGNAEGADRVVTTLVDESIRSLSPMEILDIQESLGAHLLLLHHTGRKQVSHSQRSCLGDSHSRRRTQETQSQASFCSVARNATNKSKEY